MCSLRMTSSSTTTTLTTRALATICVAKSRTSITCGPEPLPSGQGENEGAGSADVCPGRVVSSNEGPRPSGVRSGISDGTTLRPDFVEPTQRRCKRGANEAKGQFVFMARAAQPYPLEVGHAAPHPGCRPVHSRLHFDILASWPFWLLYLPTLILGMPGRSPMGLCQFQAIER
jgi:hypothetical protein